MRVIYIQKTPLLLTVIYPREHKTTVFASRPESYLAATAIGYFTRPIPNPLPLTSPRSALCLQIPMFTTVAFPLGCTSNEYHSDTRGCEVGSNAITSVPEHHMGMAEPLNVAGAPPGELSPVARFLDSYEGASLEVWRHELAGPMGTMSVFQHTHRRGGRITRHAQTPQRSKILSSNTLVTFSSFVILRPENGSIVRVGSCKFGGFRVDRCGGVGTRSRVDLSMGCEMADAPSDCS
jgi:hypothetical protein